MATLDFQQSPIRYRAKIYEQAQLCETTLDLLQSMQLLMARFDGFEEGQGPPQGGELMEILLQNYKERMVNQEQLTLEGLEQMTQQLQRSQEKAGNQKNFEVSLERQKKLNENDIGVYLPPKQSNYANTMVGTPVKSLLKRKVNISLTNQHKFEQNFGLSDRLIKGSIAVGNVLDFNHQIDSNALSPAAQSTEQDTIVNFASSSLRKPNISDV